jgi:hypothetical protein
VYVEETGEPAPVPVGLARHQTKWSSDQVGPPGPPPAALSSPLTPEGGLGGDEISASGLAVRQLLDTPPLSSACLSAAAFSSELPPSRADRPGDSRSNISSRCTSLSVGRFFAFQYFQYFFFFDLLTPLGEGTAPAC